MKKLTLITCLISTAIMAVILATGGVHAEKADDARWEKIYGSTDIEGLDLRDDSRSDCDGGDRDQERPEEEVSWLDQVLTRLEAEDEKADFDIVESEPVGVAAPEAEEEIYPDSEVTDGNSDILDDGGTADDTSGVLGDPGSADTSDYELSDEEVSGDEWDATDGSGDAADCPDSGDAEELDLWELGLQKWGISYTDTSRTLRLITYEGYGDSWLSYYVACCCWVRATEGYWGVWQPLLSLRRDRHAVRSLDGRAGHSRLRLLLSGDVLSGADILPVLQWAGTAERVYIHGTRLLCLQLKGDKT